MSAHRKDLAAGIEVGVVGSRLLLTRSRPRDQTELDQARDPDHARSRRRSSRRRRLPPPRPGRRMTTGSQHHMTMRRAQLAASFVDDLGVRPSTPACRGPERRSSLVIGTFAGTAAISPLRRRHRPTAAAVNVDCTCATDSSASSTCQGRAPGIGARARHSGAWSTWPARCARPAIALVLHSTFRTNPQITEVSEMSDFKKGDRLVVLRLDSDETECHGSYAGERGLIMFVLPDHDDLPDPIEVGASRVFPEKGQRAP